METIKLLVLFVLVIFVLVLLSFTMSQIPEGSTQWWMIVGGA